jgi:hypothetical protein
VPNIRSATLAEGWGLGGGRRGKLESSNSYLQSTTKDERAYAYDERTYACAKLVPTPTHTPRRLTAYNQRKTEPNNCATSNKSSSRMIDKHTHRRMTDDGHTARLIAASSRSCTVWRRNTSRGRVCTSEISGMHEASGLRAAATLPLLAWQRAACGAGRQQKTGSYRCRSLHEHPLIRSSLGGGCSANHSLA